MRWDYLFLWITALGNLFKRKKDVAPITACLNCSEELNEEENFCPNCGQKKRSSKITVWNLIAEFLSSVLNIDNGAWRSLRNIIRPGFLAREFIEGRRKMYFNPVRFFFLALIVHFSIIAFVLNIDELDLQSQEQYIKIGQSQLKKDYYHLKDSVFVFNEEEGIAVNTISDSIFGKFEMPEEDTLRADLNLGFINFAEYPMLRKDVFQLSGDELLTKYEVEDFWHRLAVSQFARTYKNLSGAVQFFIGNMIWGIISSIFILALVMKVLYIRRNRYYVEHLMVLFDIHTFSFILFSIALLVFNANSEYSGWAFGSAGILTFFYFFLSLKKYYQQGYIKSFIKFVIIGFSYFSIMMIMIGLVFLASLLLFK